MPTKVHPAVLEGLEAVRESGQTNMFDRESVVAIALQLGYRQTALWVNDKANREQYASGIFEGFESEEEQND